MHGSELFQADDRRTARGAVGQDCASYPAQTYYRDVVAHALNQMATLVADLAEVGVARDGLCKVSSDE